MSDHFSLPHRLVALPRKIQAHGWNWAVRRLGAEFRVPTTGPGRLIRGVLVAGLKLVAKLFAGRRVGNTLFAFYDLEVMPVTFDAVSFLALADLARRKAMLPNLHMVIVPGRNAGLREENLDYEAAINVDVRRWRLRHIILPLRSLLPVPGGQTLCASREEGERVWRTARHTWPEGYSVDFPVASATDGPIVQAAELRANYPLLRAPDQACRYVRQFLDAHADGRPTIVFSLRESPYSVARNSDIAATAQVARELSPRFAVILVPDTDTAMDLPPPELAAFPICSAAAFNLEIRMALYEAALIVAGVAQGPFELCWYSDRCRYVSFLEPGLSPQTEPHFLRQRKVICGTSPAFTLSSHRWVWQRDKAGTMLEAIDDLADWLDAQPRLTRNWYPYHEL